MRRQQVPIALFIALLGGALLASCGQENEPNKAKTEVTTQDVKREAKEAVQTTAAYASQKKEKYVSEAETRYNELKQRIDELAAKGESLKDEAKADIKKQIGELQAKQADVLDRLEEMKSASGEAWKDVASGFEAAFEELEKAYQDALSRFRQA